MRLTCGGGPTFPAAGLEAPTGAENASGPAFDALRAALAKFGSEFPGSSAWTWQLAGMDQTGAIFLARTDGTDAARWAVVTVAVDSTGWHPGGMGVGCKPAVVLSAEYGPARWALDPAHASPAPDTTELHILVWEMACSSGSPATGRMSAPIVDYGPSTVTMTIGVRPLGGAQTCPGPPGTPEIVTLAEPLGARTLLDGGTVPPAPPSPRF